MQKCPWESNDDFRTRNEFDRLVHWINEQVASEEAEEVAVARPYLDAPSFTEK